MSKNVIAKGAAILMAATIASRLLGYVREMAVTHHFGADWWTGAFAVAFNLPDLIYYLLAGGALGAAFIPVLREYLARQDVEGGHCLANSLLNLLLVALVSAGTLAIVFAPQLIRVIVPKYIPGADPPRYELTVTLTRILMFQMVLAGISALLTALLQCHDHFTWPAVSWSVYNVGIIFGAVVLSRLLGGPPQHQIYGVAIGVVLGAIMMVAVQLPSLRRVGFRWRPTMNLADPDIRRVLRSWVPIMLALAFSQFNLLWLPVNLGSYLSNNIPGLEWSIRLAQRLILIPFGLFGAAIATAAFPTISTLARTGQMLEMRRVFSRSLSAMIFFTLPSSAGLIVLALPFTRAMWRHGAYSDLAAKQNAQMLTLFSLGLVALCTLQLVNRAFFALKEVKRPLFVGAGCFGLNLVLCLGLMRTPLSYRGIALGTSLAFFANALVLLVMLRKKMAGIDGARLLDTFWRCLAATLFMSLLAYLGSSVLVGKDTHIGKYSLPMLQSFAGIALAIPGYLIATYLLGVPEAKQTWQRIIKKIRRSAA
jgi:putative peptidoglycan lipid II flippase